MSVTQEFSEIKNNIKHAKTILALKVFEKRARQKLSEFSGNLIDKRIKKLALKEYRATMKLISKIAKSL